MPFEPFRLEADGQTRPFCSVMRSASVDKMLADEADPVFAVDANTTEVVGVSTGFPDRSITGLTTADVLLSIAARAVSGLRLPSPFR